MIPACKNEPDEVSTASTSLSIMKNSKKTEISSEVVKKLQKIKFQDSLDSPSKKSKI
jgi:hypothetical protein